MKKCWYFFFVALSQVCAAYQESFRLNQTAPEQEVSIDQSLDDDNERASSDIDVTTMDHATTTRPVGSDAHKPPPPSESLSSDLLDLDLTCISYLPMSVSHNTSATTTSDNLQELLFPSMKSVSTCLSLNEHTLSRYFHRSKFCLGTFSLDPQTYLGIHGPLRLGISVGLCVPDRCTSQRFGKLFNLLCSIPECAELREPRLINICSHFQPLLCGPMDRFSFEHQFQLTCLDRISLESDEERWNRDMKQFREEVEIVQSLIDDLSHPEGILSILKALIPLQTLKQNLRDDGVDEEKSRLSAAPAIISRSLLVGNQANEHDENDDGDVSVNPDFAFDAPKLRVDFGHVEDAQIDLDLLEVLLECGSDTLAHAPSLYFKTGGFQNLGSWDLCSSAADRKLPKTARDHITSEESDTITPLWEPRYCLLRYLSLLGSGHCMSSNCDDRKLDLLARMLCNMSTGRLGVWESCLDLVNLIPLDICILVQLFGCNDYKKLSALLQDDVDSWAIIATMLGSHAPSMGDEAPRRLLEATGSLRSRLPSLIWQFMDVQQLEGLSASLRRLSGNRNKLGLRPIIDVRPSGELTCQAFCDITHPSRRPWTFTLAMMLLLMFFVVLPLTACVVKSFSETVSETALELARRSTAQKLLLYQYPRSPKPRHGGGFLRDRTSPPLGPSPQSSNISSPPREVKSLVPKGQLESFIMCFHPGDNWSSYETTVKNVQIGEFPHLCGLRVASMVWIVMAHTFSFMASTGLVSNVKTGLQLLHRLDFQFIIGGMYAVDSFFFFTGFLVAVYGGPSLQLVVQSANRGTVARNQASKLLLNLKILFFSILHRYLRLGGVYFTLLILWICAIPYLSSGPMWPALINWIRHGYVGGCQKYWWTNVLFINNLVPYFGGGDCMGWTWYLANDFQFFIISTTMLLVRRASVKSFIFLCAVLFGVSWGIALVTIVQHQLTTALLGIPFSRSMQSTLFETVRANEMFYSKPWCRFPPHLIGVIWGVIYRTGRFEEWVMGITTSENQRTPSEMSVSEKMTDTPRLGSTGSSPIGSRLTPGAFKVESPSLSPQTPSNMRFLPPDIKGTKPTRAAMVPWIHVLASLTMATLVFVQYVPNNSMVYFWPRWIDVAYQVFARSVWGVCLGWFCVSLTYAISEHRNRPRLLDQDLLSKQVLPFLHFPSPLINDCLSRALLRFWGAPVFISLASFCFCVYLLHPILQSIYFASTLSAFYESQGVGYFSGIGFCILSFLAAVPFTLCIEISLSKCARLIGV